MREGERVAFVGFRYDGRALPLDSLEDEIHAFAVRQNQHRTHLSRPHAHFLSALAHGRVRHRLAAIAMAAGECEAAIHDAGVGAAQEQHVAVPEHQSVDDDGEGVSPLRSHVGNPNRFVRGPRERLVFFVAAVHAGALVFEAGQKILGGWIFALLVAAVFGQIWFASMPAPFGGPNIVPAAAAALLAVVLCVCHTAALARDEGVRAAFRLGVLARFRPAMPAFLVALLMWTWELAVYLRTGTFDSMRLGQFTVGLGVLFAFLAVCSVRRAKGLIAAIVIATAVSALFGISVLVVGEPFLGVWMRIATVAESNLEAIIVYGRSAGAAAHISSFAYQMVVAIPLGFAGLVFGVFRRGGRWRWLDDAALFLLVAAMLAALLINASRSTGLGVCVGIGLCVVGVLTGADRRFGTRRLLIVVPTMTLLLLAFFNPWLNVGSVVDELRPVGRDRGDIEALTAGPDALSSGDRRVVGHRLEGYRPGTEYVVMLRERYRKGFGHGTELRLTADADGGLVFTWRAKVDRNLIDYQVRLREASASTWQAWYQVVPSLRSQNPVPAVESLTVRMTAWPAGEDSIIGAQVADLWPRREYELQVRVVLPRQDGPPSQVRARTDENGRFVFTWRRVPWADVAYQYRLRLPSEEDWSPWRACELTDPDPLVWPGLESGSKTLATTVPKAERKGERFYGFREWKWYKVQVRQKIAGDVERSPLHGEFVVKPERGGNFVVTWPAPPTPAGVAAYQMRARELSRTDWGPWRDFIPSLTSKTPVLSVLSAGWSVVQNPDLVRHTLLGLPAETPQSVELRTRGAGGFGQESAVHGRSAEDGSFVLAWSEPPRAHVADYQFRLWSKDNLEWHPWQNLAPNVRGGYTLADLTHGTHSPDRALAAARNAQNFAGALRVQRRLFRGSLPDNRFSQAATALRYAFDHPLGTGAYRPRLSHAGEDVPDAVREGVLWLWPHNQFLHVLVLFGLPGLVLHLLFYCLLARAAWRAGKMVWRERRTDLRFLVAAVVAAWSAYTVNSMFLPTGPFVQDWGHYFVLALLLGLEGALAKERQ